MTTPSDPELSLHAQLARHQARVRTLVRSLLRDEHAAEDIVQDAWVTTLQRPPAMGHGSGDSDTGAQPLGAWFGRVARNLALNSRRSDLRRREREQRAGEWRHAKDGCIALSSDEIVARLELQRRLVAALESLAEPHRSLLRDHFLGEQSMASIALRDDVAESTLRSRLKRGLSDLRSELASEPFPSDDHGVQHWSLALAPLAAIPAVRVPLSLVPKATGFTRVGPSILANLGSLAGVLIMKKAALTTVALLLMGALVWRVADSDQAKSGGAPESVEPALASSPSMERKESALELAEPPARESTRTLPPSPTVVNDVALATHAITISGSIRLDGTVSPPPPTTVSVRMHNGFDSSGEVVAQRDLQSDTEGRFRLMFDRPDGTVTLTARAALDEAVQWRGSEAVVLESESEARLDLTFVPLDTMIHGTVLAPDGQPAAEAQVTWGGRKVMADDYGKYELMVAPQIVHRIRASHADHGQATAIPGTLERGSRTRLDFTLTNQLNIRGTVRDSDGEPVEGARVATFYGGNLHGITDLNGQYVIQGLSRTDHKDVMVSARCTGYLMSQSSAVIPDEGGLDMDLTMERGSRLGGRIVATNGAPLSGVQLCLGRSRHDITKLETTTDDHGNFEFLCAPVGEQRLWFAATDFAEAHVMVTVPEAGDPHDDVIIKLTDGRTVHGRVQDVNGRPVEGLRIAFRQGPSLLERHTVSAADGTFELSGLPDGDLVASSYGEGWVRGLAPVAADGTVTISAERTGSVRGSVVDAATGLPIEAFTIRWIEPQLGVGEERADGGDYSWYQEGHTFEDLNGRWDLGRETGAVGQVLGLKASAPGYAPSTNAHVVVQQIGSATEVVLKLVARHE